MSFQGGVTLVGLVVLALGLIPSLVPAARGRPRRSSRSSAETVLVVGGLVIFGAGVVLQFVLGAIALSQF
jgi:uncharacterized protein YjeT (DUF2065 family)